MRTGRKVVDGLALGAMAGACNLGATDGIIISGVLVRVLGAGESSLGFAVGDWFAGRCVGSERGARETNGGVADGFFVTRLAVGAEGAFADGIISSGVLVRVMGAGESNLGFAVGDMFAGRCVGSERGARETNGGAADGLIVTGPTVGAKESNRGAAAGGIVIAGVLVRAMGAGESNSSLGNGVLVAGVLVETVGARGSHCGINDGRCVAGLLVHGVSVGNGGERVIGGKLCAGCGIGLTPIVGAKPLAREKRTVYGAERLPLSNTTAAVMVCCPATSWAHLAKWTPHMAYGAVRSMR
jgi:hypothetical protein